MEVIIDCEKCGNCQRCVDACPEVFMKLLGRVVILYKNVPLALQPDCLYAREVCPAQAIEIQKSTGVFLDD